MRHISKARRPVALAESAHENRDHIQSGVFNWDSLPTEIKRDVHASLLSEQGYICCYCGDGIEAADSHVEHLRPRSRFPGPPVFDYENNLMAS